MMSKARLDQELVQRGLVSTRSQAESYIKLGYVKVNKLPATKPGQLVRSNDKIILTATEQYVSRAALKLASVAKVLQLTFKDKVVLDVGSSTGGFTDYSLQHGARKVIAIDVGTDQLHPSLRTNPRIELYEQTDILDVRRWTVDDRNKDSNVYRLTSIPDLVLIDVSFTSIRPILRHLITLVELQTQVIAMVKPQFEAELSSLKHKGVIKNDRMRRDILKDFETWAQQYFVIIDKADSEVAGSKGNLERFYLLQKLR
jgi:23S rRNA (cytidine1920-2'-O)/16S rRNA (cytidine1409-2'-O)-methyltransferase